MTALEKITAFVGGYPGADILREFQIDYTDQIFINGGALPPRIGGDQAEGRPDGPRGRGQPVQFRAALCR